MFLFIITTLIMRVVFVEYARFSICYAPSMAERQDLLVIRNEIINADCGVILLRFLHDFVTDCATRNCDPAEIKGMCRMLQAFKDIPSEIDKRRS